jgi:hypothetical protein
MHILHTVHALLIRHKVETAVSANAVVMAGLIKSWCSEVWNVVLCWLRCLGLSYISVISTNAQQKKKLFLCRHAVMADVCYTLLRRYTTFFRPYLGFLSRVFVKLRTCYPNCMPYKRRKLRRERSKLKGTFRRQNTFSASIRATIV